MPHLKDGTVISIGRKRSHLVHVETRDQHELGFADLQSIQALTLGHPLPDSPLLNQLKEEGVLLEGPATVDKVLQSKLAQFDDLYLESYRHTLSEREERAYQLVLAAHARRKQFYTGVGQCPVLPETALRRALHVGDAERTGPQKIVCVGDDDLVSVALAALGHEVLSCDIDDYLLSFLADTAEEFKLNLRVQQLDLRDPLPEKYRDAFDIFLTDPMSNRECFELFLSRAFAMLKPNGRGFTAVYAPTTRILQELAAEMNLSVVKWHRRHNRYYSHFIKLHRYESDWVEIEKTPETVLPCPPEEHATPLQLYREDYYQRPITLLELYDEIEDVKFATPFYLDMLLDTLVAHEDLKEVSRSWHYAQDWTVAHITTDTGYLSLHVHRPRRQLLLNCYPFIPEIEETARTLLFNAYKQNSTTVYSATSDELRDLRLR